VRVGLPAVNQPWPQIAPASLGSKSSREEHAARFRKVACEGKEHASRLRKTESGLLFSSFRVSSNAMRDAKQASKLRENAHLRLFEASALREIELRPAVQASGLRKNLAGNSAPRIRMSGNAAPRVLQAFALSKTAREHISEGFAVCQPNDSRASTALGAQIPMLWTSLLHPHARGTRIDNCRTRLPVIRKREIKRTIAFPTPRL
jgi:hypothetical protein